MNNLSKKIAKNIDFQAVKLSKRDLRNVKGGGDIITQDVVDA